MPTPYRVQSNPPRIEWFGGFCPRDAVVRYQTQYPDLDHSHGIIDVAANIRAVVFFNADNLSLLTSGGEVIKS